MNPPPGDPLPEHVGDAEIEPLFYERRRGSFVFWGLAVGLPAALLYSAWKGVGEPVPLSREIGAAVFAALLYALIMAGFLGPIGGEFKHVRVDGRGVWVRRRLLPAAEIGEVRALREGEAARATASSRVDGMWLFRGVATYNHISSHGSAVYIEQLCADGRRRPWLLATHRPGELVAAAEAVRDAAGGGRS